VIPVVRPDTPRSALYDAAMQQPVNGVYEAVANVLHDFKSVISSRHASHGVPDAPSPSAKLVQETKAKFPRLEHDFRERQFSYDPQRLRDTPFLNQYGEDLELTPSAMGKDMLGEIDDWVELVKSWLSIDEDQFAALQRQGGKWLEHDGYPALHARQQEMTGIRVNNDPDSPVFMQKELYAIERLPKLTGVGVDGSIILKDAGGSDPVLRQAMTVVDALAGIQEGKFQHVVSVQDFHSGDIADYTADYKSPFMMMNTAVNPDGTPNRDAINLIPVPVSAQDKKSNSYVVHYYVTTRDVDAEEALLLDYVLQTDDTEGGKG
jgi:hypothetical protein